MTTMYRHKQKGLCRSWWVDNILIDADCYRSKLDSNQVNIKVTQLYETGKTDLFLAVSIRAKSPSEADEKVLAYLDSLEASQLTIAEAKEIERQQALMRGETVA